jgi:hypothetical protein
MERLFLRPNHWTPFPPGDVQAATHCVDLYNAAGIWQSTSYHATKAEAQRHMRRIRAWNRRHRTGRGADSR